MNKTNISSIIRNARLQAGLSQKALASLADISQQAVQQMESGKRAVGINALQNVVNALNIEVNITLKPLKTKEKRK